MIDIDPSTLRKIERRKQSANKEMLPILADQLKEDEQNIRLILLSDKDSNELIEEENPIEIFKVAEEKIKYIKTKKLQQGNLDF